MKKIVKLSYIDIQLQNFQGRNPHNIFVAKMENGWLHIFNLNLSEL
jgi:hypothetical protein